MLIPSSVSEPSAMIAQALAIYGQVVRRGGGGSSGGDGGRGGHGEDSSAQEREAAAEGGSAAGQGRSAASYASTSALSAPSYFQHANTQLPSSLFPAPPSQRPGTISEPRKG